MVMRMLVPLLFMAAINPFRATAQSLFDDKNVIATNDLLQSRIAFWEGVYADYRRDQVVIHDSKHLEIVYAVITLPERGEWRRTLGQKLAKYRTIVEKFARRDPVFSYLDNDEIQVYSQFADIAEKDKFWGAAERIRWQRGLREQVAEALEQSGKYLEMVRRIFREQGLPDELTSLMFVESLCNNTAVSSAGAVGLWQLTGPGGSEYLKINRFVDERLNPILSSTAAAKTLARNKRVFGSWPLAITAYNTGVTGLKRALKSVDADDLPLAIERVQGGSFGFASKNFYAEFIAMAKIVKARDRRFPRLSLAQFQGYDIVTLAKPCSVKTITQMTGLAEKVIRKYNPALTREVLSSSLPMPKNFKLKLPLNYGQILAQRLKTKTSDRSID